MRQLWAYKARDPKGAAVSGEIEGESAEQVLRLVSEQGLIPTAIKPTSEKRTIKDLFSNFGAANRERLIIFTKKLMTLYRAGIPLLRALSIIERGAEELKMVEEIEGIKNDLHAGVPLSKALARYPQKFPRIYIASVTAGEASGTLDEVLEHLAVLVEKEMVLARQVKSALRYPVMVIAAITIAVFVLMTFVIPRFTSLYSKFGADLPLATKIVMSVSQFFTAYWWVMILVLVAILFGLKKFISTPKGRLIWDEGILRLPIVGDLVLKAGIARFSTMLKSLFRSGVPMVTCLNVLSDTASNTVLAAEIASLADSFEKGRELGREMEKYTYFPSMALEMFQVGLESGSVETIMGELATHYEMELEYKSRHLTAMLEPILTIVIGIMVLVLALSIFLPMWNLIKVFR